MQDDIEINKKIHSSDEVELPPIIKCDGKDTKSILKERKSKYGEAYRHGELSQRLKRVLRIHVERYGTPDAFTDLMTESLEMICHKIARISNGDPTYVDSWQDIAGYAELVVKELNKPKDIEC